MPIYEKGHVAIIRSETLFDWWAIVDGAYQALIVDDPELSRTLEDLAEEMKNAPLMKVA